MKNKNKPRIGLAVSLAFFFIAWGVMFLEISFFQHKAYKGLLASIVFIVMLASLLMIFIFTGLLAKRLNRSVWGYCVGVCAYLIPPLILLFLKEKEVKEEEEEPVPEDMKELYELKEKMIKSREKAEQARKKGEASLDKFKEAAQKIKAEQDAASNATFVVILHEMMKSSSSDMIYPNLIAEAGVPFQEGIPLTLLTFGEQINPDYTMAMTYLTMQGPAYDIDVGSVELHEYSFENDILGRGILLWG